MRKIRIIEQISLDGVIQAPGGRDEGGDDYAHGGWTAPYRNAAMGEAVAEAQGRSFDLLLGRRTYDIFAGYWPKAGNGLDRCGPNLPTLLLEVQMTNHESESIRVTRVLPGSPDRVFDAWFNPSIVQHWLAPKADVDARAGGHFREVAKAEGTHVVTGKYREFIPNERLVMTWVYDGPITANGEACQSCIPGHYRKRFMDEGLGQTGDDPGRAINTNCIDEWQRARSGVYYDRMPRPLQERLGRN